MGDLAGQSVTYSVVLGRASQGWKHIFASGKAWDENETDCAIYNRLPLSASVAHSRYDFYSTMEMTSPCGL